MNSFHTFCAGFQLAAALHFCTTGQFLALLWCATFTVVSLMLARLT